LKGEKGCEWNDVRFLVVKKKLYTLEKMKFVKREDFLKVYLRKNSNDYHLTLNHIISLTNCFLALEPQIRSFRLGLVLLRKEDGECLVKNQVSNLNWKLWGMLHVESVFT